MDTIILILLLLLGFILGYILINILVRARHKYMLKEHFGTDDYANNLKNSITSKLQDIPGDITNKIKNAGLSILSNPENIDPTGTVRFIKNTVPGVASTLNGVSNAANLTIKAGDETITTLSNMTNNNIDGLGKIFKGDPIGGISQIGTGTLNGVTDSGKIVGFFVKDQALNIGNTVVNVGKDIERGFVDFGNTLSNTFSGAGPALKQFGDDTKRTFEDYGNYAKNKINESGDKFKQGDVGGGLKSFFESF